MANQEGDYDADPDTDQRNGAGAVFYDNYSAANNLRHLPQMPSQIGPPS